MNTQRKNNEDFLSAINNLIPAIIGSESIVNKLSHAQHQVSRTYPPYNVLRYKDGDSMKWKIEIALAGINKEDIDIFYESGSLKVSYESKKVVSDPEKTESADDIIKKFSEKQYIHQGISNRSFTKIFNLGEYVEVEDVTYDNGMLYISLFQNIPESKKPKRIEIK